MFQHAFPIVAHFDWALAVTFAAPAASLLPLVALGLALDTFKHCGFLAVACVKTRRLRPRGFPERIGVDFFLVGYRLFVRFDSPSGRRYRGLQIFGSETDRWSVALGGRVLTRYAYRKVRATVARDHGAVHVATSSGLNVVVREEAHLPAGSAFDDAAEARRYAGPMPFTFAAVRGGRAILRVEGSRVHEARSADDRVNILAQEADQVVDRAMLGLLTNPHTGYVLDRDDVLRCWSIWHEPQIVHTMAVNRATVASVVALGAAAAQWAFYVKSIDYEVYLPPTAVMKRSLIAT